MEKRTEKVRKLLRIFPPKVSKFEFFAGPCKGDSGGGVYVRKDNKWTLVGITSASLFAENTCDLHNYVIFTDVGKHDEFILGNIF